METPMIFKRTSPRIPAIRETVLEALRHSLCASRLSQAAQMHAREPNIESFQNMAESADRMIDALDSLHETLQLLLLALEPRDIDLSRIHLEDCELVWPLTTGRKSAGLRHTK
jgi:hypothetical protein